MPLKKPKYIYLCIGNSGGRATGISIATIIINRRQDANKGGTSTTTLWIKRKLPAQVNGINMAKNKSKNRI